MIPTEHLAKSASKSKAGISALLGALLRVQGGGASKIAFPGTGARIRMSLQAAGIRGGGFGTLWRLAPVSSLAAIVLILATFATPAQAETPTQPWFHLSSGARPTYLSPGAKGTAVGEVQELKVTLGTFEEEEGKVKIPEQALFFLNLKVNGEERLLGRFATEPAAGKFSGVFALLTAANIKKALEEKVYGNGQVQVEEVKGPGALVFKITALNPGSSATFTTTPVRTGEEQFTVLTKGSYHGPELIDTAINVGDASTGECVEVAPGAGKYTSSECGAEGTGEEAKFEKQPVKLTDTLPAGLKAISAQVAVNGSGGNTAAAGTCSLLSPRQAQCTLEGPLLPFAQVEVRVGVLVEPDASTGEQNALSVSGGGAPNLQIKHPITISSSPAPFGVEAYELTPEEAGGAPDTQAGSHPFQLTTTFALNQAAGGLVASIGKYETQPVALAKDLAFKLPPGLVGNPHPFARCSLAQFGALEVSCAPDTVLGVAVVTVEEPGNLGLFTKTVPLYNLEPAVGEPARFGFRPTKETPVFLNTSVRTGEDYGVTVSVPNITQVIGFVTNTVTFWGVPGAPSHDSERGVNCLVSGGEAQGPCQPLEAVSPPPFLDLPGSCSGEPLHTEVLADSWDAPSEVLPVPATVPLPRLDGCNQLPFKAEIRVNPDVQEASKPSGLTVDVHVPQEEALKAEGLAPSELKNITVTLPEGLNLNPSAADGLQACTQAQVGLSNDNEVACPNASKIANVTIRTPLLPNTIDGFVYLASPQNFRNGLPENPFESLVAMYLVAKDPVSGTLIKLAGSVSLNQSTGQIESTFANNPQLPFEDAELKFFGGERAPLATPQRCGTYTTDASFTPWSTLPGGTSSSEAIGSQASFAITTGAGGGACPGASLPFAPSLASGVTNIDAGAFSELTTTLSRPSSDQPIQSVVLHYPPGLSGLLSGVALCGEAQANAGTCGPASEIGETIVSVGVGGEPFTVTGGRVYITEHYAGAPFGLSIVNPAKAGPFDLQEGRPVVVRARIEVNPLTAALTITTDPSGAHAIPHIIEGFALQIQHVNVLINRKGFTFNPTNCNPTQVTGVVNSAEGATSPVSVPFQVTNCASLKFTPKFAVSTSGKTSKAKGASLTAKVSEPSEPQGSQSNITKVKVELPKQLPSRLTTLQKACTDKQFETNPANCPKESKIGYAVVHTPLLPVPLEGPAIFVSHGGEAFPSLEIVLQGYGVTIDLVGTTFISKSGITSTTFKTVPDQPFSSFQLTLPEGKFSALAANGNLCKQKLTMPSEFVGQNGAVFKQSTKVAVTGCKKTKKAAKKKHRKRKTSRHGKRGK